MDISLRNKQSCDAFLTMSLKIVQGDTGREVNGRRRLLGNIHRFERVRGHCSSCSSGRPHRIAHLLKKKSKGIGQEQVC